MTTPLCLPRDISTPSSLPPPSDRLPSRLSLRLGPASATKRGSTLRWRGEAARWHPLAAQQIPGAREISRVSGFPVTLRRHQYAAAFPGALPSGQSGFFPRQEACGSLHTAQWQHGSILTRTWRSHCSIGRSCSVYYGTTPRPVAWGSWVSSLHNTLLVFCRLRLHSTSAYVWLLLAIHAVRLFHRLPAQLPHVPVTEPRPKTSCGANAAWERVNDGNKHCTFCYPSTTLCCPLTPSPTTARPQLSSVAQAPSRLASLLAPSWPRMLGHLVPNMPVIKMALSVLSETPTWSRMARAGPVKGLSARLLGTVQGQRGAARLKRAVIFRMTWERCSQRPEVSSERSMVGMLGFGSSSCLVFGARRSLEELERPLMHSSEGGWR